MCHYQIYREGFEGLDLIIHESNHSNGFQLRGWNDKGEGFPIAVGINSAKKQSFALSFTLKACKMISWANLVSSLFVINISRI